MREQSFYGHGKLLLSGEYFVLDGAKALALPCSLGQIMNVSYRRSNDPKLIWRSRDPEGNVWFEATYDVWRFRILSEETSDAIELQKILQQARTQNIHFLRDEVDTVVETTLEFPLNWGLGSSSTLIYNIAQWAYVSPFELLSKTFGGSGYDIACAQSMGPIIYSTGAKGPTWQSMKFSPLFKDKLFFVHLNKKQNSRSEVERYKSIEIEDKQALVKKLDACTELMASSIDLKEFEEALLDHENIVSQALDTPRTQHILFSDYWGVVKSLGAWGGDFVMVTSDRSPEETRAYFANKGYKTVLSYDEIICNKSFENLSGLSLEEVSQGAHELEA